MSPSIRLLKQKGIAQYGSIEGLHELREAICKKIRKENRISAKPEGAFYIFANIKKFGMSSFNFVKFLIRNGVATVPGSDFGNEGEGYVRFSFSCPIETIDKGMDRVESALKKLR